LSRSICPRDEYEVFILFSGATQAFWFEKILSPGILDVNGFNLCIWIQKLHYISYSKPTLHR
jgi:hypothetical protein